MINSMFKILNMTKVILNISNSLLYMPLVIPSLNIGEDLDKILTVFFNSA